MASTAPFSRFEWMIAWRYLSARRAEGGVSVMTWISLAGITLAVFALIATLASPVAAALVAVVLLTSAIFVLAMLRRLLSRQSRRPAP